MFEIGLQELFIVLMSVPVLFVSVFGLALLGFVTFSFLAFRGMGQALRKATR
jgi:hypothetical protein